MSAGQATSDAAMKIMESVDPEAIHMILLATFTGCMSCLVTLKDQQLSIITQGMDVGQQVGKSLRA